MSRRRLIARPASSTAWIHWRLPCSFCLVPLTVVKPMGWLQEVWNQLTSTLVGMPCMWLVRVGIRPSYSSIQQRYVGSFPNLSRNFQIHFLAVEFCTVIPQNMVRRPCDRTNQVIDSTDKRSPPYKWMTSVKRPGANL